MIRLIGVLTGSALAIALLLLVLGVPRLGEREVIEQAAEPTSGVPVAAAAAMPVTPEPLPHEPLPHETAAEPVRETKAEPVAEPEPITDPEPASVTAVSVNADPEPLIADSVMADSEMADSEMADSEMADSEMADSVTADSEMADAALVESIMTGSVTTNEPTAQNWFAFWSPFRSRIAADGFVAELSRTTGLDYRVVKLKPGVFEVAVAYTDDDDIQDKLLRISAATGLDMTGG